MLLLVCLGAYHVYAHGGQVAKQLVSKSRAVSAQFYHEISMLAQNLAEAERVLYANHRVEEELLHLLAQAAKRSTPTSGVSIPPQFDLVIGLEEGIKLGTQDPQQLLGLCCISSVDYNMLLS